MNKRVLHLFGCYNSEEYANLIEYFAADKSAADRVAKC